jgi:hypothetical protein
LFNRKETFEFSSSVAPGDTETETVVLDEDATVEEIVVRWYRGPELYLGIMPFVESVEDADRTEREDLISVHGRDFLVGENDREPYHVDAPVEKHDELGVEVTNTTDQLAAEHQFDYDYRCKITVDYRGGTSRWIPSVLQGVFS